MSATILDMSQVRARPVRANGDLEQSLELLARQELRERLGAAALQCEAQSRWLDRPEPDILEARLCLVSLREDVGRIRELVRALIG
jgi:hypothetical protein